MSTFWNVLIVILLVLVIALALLYYFGQKAQKKQAAQQEQLEATRQVVSMLIIDKKRLKLKESGLPQIVIDQTPWYMRRTKIPVVKAKIGPKIQTLISETTIFDSIPVKKEIKAVVSGIYITEIKSVRGGRVEAPQQKKSRVSVFPKSFFASQKSSMHLLPKIPRERKRRNKNFQVHAYREIWMHFLFGIRTDADAAVCNILTVDLQCVFYLHINAVFFFADIQMCCGDPDQESSKWGVIIRFAFFVFFEHHMHVCHPASGQFQTAVFDFQKIAGSLHWNLPVLHRT